MSDANTSLAALPLTVLGGYLGAGKTTLVNRLLRRAEGRRLAVLVNEFGDLPIDADLIEAKDGNLISLAGGCVCCSFGDDLGASIAELRALDPPPDHIVLEASGVALPGSVAATLSLIPGIDLHSVIVLADAERIGALLKNEYLSDTVERQLYDGDLILLTKTDLIAPERVGQNEDLIETVAPDCRIVPTDMSAIEPAFVLDRHHRKKSTQPDHSDHHDHRHSQAIDASIRTFDAPIDAERLAKELQNDPDIVRAKGHLRTLPDGDLVTLQLVGDRYALTPAPPKAKPGIVVMRLTHG